METLLIWIWEVVALVELALLAWVLGSKFFVDNLVNRANGAYPVFFRTQPIGESL